MRLAINERAGRVFGRLPRPTVYSALELALLALIAVQAARLFWILVTPVGPVGDWKGPAALLPAGDGSALTGFDPFFRLAPAGPGVVTSLNLTLFGVREDRATGRGSAIIGLPDGSQQSFAVGDEILPGVTLAEVGFDGVTISRGGAREQIFLDQSEPAAPADDAAATAPPGPPSAAPVQPPRAAPAPPPPAAPAAEIELQPRTSGGRVQGVAVAGDAQALRAAGLVPGDVMLAVQGQRVSSTEQAWALLRQAGGQATVLVNRGGRVVPIVVRIEP